MNVSDTLNFELSSEQEGALTAVATAELPEDFKQPEDFEQFEPSYRAWNAHFTEPGRLELSYRAWNAYFVEPAMA